MFLYDTLFCFSSYIYISYKTQKYYVFAVAYSTHRDWNILIMILGSVNFLFLCVGVPPVFDLFVSCPRSLFFLANCWCLFFGSASSHSTYTGDNKGMIPLDEVVVGEMHLLVSIWRRSDVECDRNFVLNLFFTDLLSLLVRPILSMLSIGSSMNEWRSSTHDIA